MFEKGCVKKTLACIKYLYFEDAGPKITHTWYWDSTIEENKPSGSLWEGTLYQQI